MIGHLAGQAGSSIPFDILGALANGVTIAVIGLLMEISPGDRRPAYSGCFSALTAPAFPFPLAGGLAVSASGIWVVFAISLAAAIARAALVIRIAPPDATTS